MKEFIINIPGFALAGKSYGKKTNPPMLALHGWLDNANSFDQIAPLFSKHFYFISIDLPGHGKSSHLPEGLQYHLVDSIGFIREIISALGYKKIHVLGHSMGACMASLCGGVIGPLIESLFLIEGLGPLTAPADTCQQQLHDYFYLYHPKDSSFPRAYDSIEQASQFRASKGRITPELSAILCARGLEKTNGKYRWRHDRRLLFPSPLRMTETMVLSCLEKITCNTALISATRGFDFGESIMKNRVKAIKNLQHFSLTGGHHMHMENPEAIYSISQQFYKPIAPEQF